MKKKALKILNKFLWILITPLSFINNKIYMSMMNKNLSRLGLKLEGKVKYVHPSLDLDSSDYSLIHIGKGVSFSKNVIILTHDFSMNTIYNELDLNNKLKLDELNKKNGIRTLNTVKIGSNSFISTNVIILPGSSIGKNCLIGAGAVIRGDIPNDSIVIGNPAKIIKNTKAWLESKDLNGESFR